MNILEELNRLNDIKRNNLKVEVFIKDKNIILDSFILSGSLELEEVTDILWDNVEDLSYEVLINHPSRCTTGTPKLSYVFDIVVNQDASPLEVVITSTDSDKVKRLDKLVDVLESFTLDTWE